MGKKKNKREPREKTKGIDFLKPIDFNKVGTEDDPCFGKLFNLSTDACKRCGDSELCSALLSQNLNKSRAKIESKNRFKDIELTEGNKALINWVKEKKKAGISRSEIIKKAKKTFGSERKEIKEIYRSLK